MRITILLAALAVLNACSEPPPVPPGAATPGAGPASPGTAPAGQPQPSDPLARAVLELDSGDAGTRGAALLRLIEAGPDSVPHLLAGAGIGSAPSPNASRALAAIGTPALPELRRALGHPDADIRLVAIQAISRMGPEAADAAPDIHRARTDPDVRVRSVAERAWQQANDEESDQSRQTREPEGAGSNGR